MRIACLKVALLGLVLGCASTTVVKNPGPNTTGLRYNLPKPYLILETAVEVSADGKSKKNIPNMVNITLEMLPDYSEEYAIQVKAGVGANKTGLTIKDGWKLEKVNFGIDSKTNENVSAIADAIGAIPKFGKSGGAETATGAETAAERQSLGFAQAFNVPLGYYESVIGTDPNGKKRLHGWRYVGFMPFNPCPTVGCGIAAAPCCNGEVYGLVCEKGVMVFKRLDQIATESAGVPVPAGNH
jgi:hypothetical protein